MSRSVLNDKQRYFYHKLCIRVAVKWIWMAITILMKSRETTKECVNNKGIHLISMRTSDERISNHIFTEILWNTRQNVKMSLITKLLALNWINQNFKILNKKKGWIPFSDVKSTWTLQLQFDVLANYSEVEHNKQM